ncbi:protein of unknown function [Nitrospina watsonii]|uniref:HTH luxR-type domain-containing protein n=1 Tax=Nitrospina watsonii TaxID=1323948 RepID=A0ABN8VZ93_9BACT|nr:protein of unknown function [Nitrospina watsonii]
MRLRSYKPKNFFFMKFREFIHSLLEKPAFRFGFKTAGVLLLILGVAGAAAFWGDVLKGGEFQFAESSEAYGLVLLWLGAMLIWIYLEKMRKDYDERLIIRKMFQRLYRAYDTGLDPERLYEILGTTKVRFFRIEDLKKYDREGFDPEKWHHAFKTVFDEEFSKLGFTKAEKEVGSLLVTGMPQEQIAEVRKTSLKTVKNQTTVIYEKAGVKNGRELIAYFVQELLPSPTESPD